MKKRNPPKLYSVHVLAVYDCRLKQRASGSGFIVRSDGLILTNAHVVAGASRVQVCLNDGEKVQGVVQAVDQVCDLATVKVQRVGMCAIYINEGLVVVINELV